MPVSAAWTSVSPLLRGSSLALVVLTGVVLLGPLLCADPDVIQDAAGTALLPPGSRRVIVSLVDGSTLAAERATQQDEEWRIHRRGEIRTLAAAEVHSLSVRRYWLGTDTLGRDVLARLLWGGRVSLLLALAALVLTTLLGTLWGIIAGWAGGIVDAVLMRLADAVLAIPMLLLVLLLAAVLRPSLAVLVVVIALSSWMGVARLVRAQVAALKQRDWVLALRAVGASPTRILLRHILPNAIAPLGQDAALRFGDLLLIEASLSFLGFGVQPPTASWGAMLAEGQSTLGAGWWLLALPAALVATTVLVSALLAEALHEKTRHLR